MLFIVCLYYAFRPFLILIIVFVVGIIVLSNCSRFLVFQIYVSIVMVSVSKIFFVLDDNDKVDIVKICCNGVYSFCVRFL